jgi:hypothetical protein
MPGVLKTPESGVVFSTVHCAHMYLCVAVHNSSKISTTAPLWQLVASCYKHYLIASDSPELRNHSSIIFSPNRLMKSSYRVSVSLSVRPSVRPCAQFQLLTELSSFHQNFCESYDIAGHYKRAFAWRHKPCSRATKISRLRQQNAP